MSSKVLMFLCYVKLSGKLTLKFLFCSPGGGAKNDETKMKKINMKCRNCRGIFNCCKILQCCTRCVELLFPSQGRRRRYDEKRCGNCMQMFATANACLSHLVNCPLPEYVREVFDSNAPIDVAKLFS